MLKLIRYLRGYADVKVTGSYPERFVNILIYNGVNVWNVQSQEGTVCFSTLASNYKHIRRLAHRKSCQIRVKSKYGLPFFLHRNSKRIGLPIGFIFSLIIFKILSAFIWTVDIYGFEQMSYIKAKEVMKKIGVYEGAFSSFDSLQNIQNDAMIAFGDVSWITVNVDGSKCDVNISETTKKGEVIDDTPYNIIASTDGQIIRVDAYSGSAVVKKGDAVGKGTLLISGFVETELGGTRISSANGIVIAQTWYNEQFSLPKKFNVSSYSPYNENRIFCRLFNLVIPLKWKYVSDDEKKYSFLKESRAEFQGNTAAVSLIEEKLYHSFDSTVIPDEKQSENILKSKILLNELFNFNDKKIISRNIKISADKNNYICNVEYECEENIGEKSEILFENTDEEIP